MEVSFFFLLTFGYVQTRDGQGGERIVILNLSFTEPSLEVVVFTDDRMR